MAPEAESQRIDRRALLALGALALAGWPGGYALEEPHPVPTSSDYLAFPQVPADERLHYGDHPAQFVDVFRPAGSGPHPTVLLLHGGCWQAAFDLTPLSGLAAALRDTGVLVWNIEYRRLGNGGGWPHTFRDVAAAADLLASHPDADRERIVAAGHSAGGHLALWLAARPGLPPVSPLWSERPLPLRGVLGIAALADLAEGARRGLCGGACVELLDGTPETTAARYAQASPAELLPLPVPHRHLVGANDRIVPPDYLAAFVARDRAATLEILPESGHFEPVSPLTPAGLRTLALLDELLRL